MNDHVFGFGFKKKLEQENAELNQKLKERCKMIKEINTDLKVKKNNFLL